MFFERIFQAAIGAPHRVIPPAHRVIANASLCIVSAISCVFIVFRTPSCRHIASAMVVVANPSGVRDRAKAIWLRCVKKINPPMAPATMHNSITLAFLTSATTSGANRARAADMAATMNAWFAFFPCASKYKAKSSPHIDIRYIRYTGRSM